VKLKITLPICFLCVSMLALTPSNAWAYVDPGTGSYVFQLAAAGFLASAYTLRRYWHAVTTALRTRFGLDRGRTTADDGE
jgi:hypothetical protein